MDMPRLFIALILLWLFTLFGLVVILIAKRGLEPTPAWHLAPAYVLGVFVGSAAFTCVRPDPQDYLVALIGLFVVPPLGGVAGGWLFVAVVARWIRARRPAGLRLALVYTLLCTIAVPLVLLAIELW